MIHTEGLRKKTVLFMERRWLFSIFTSTFINLTYIQPNVFIKKLLQKFPICRNHKSATFLGAVGAAAPQSATPENAGGISAILPNLAISWSGYFQALAVLCFAMGLLWALLWLIKKKGSINFFQSSGTNLKVESRLALGPKKWILVVNCIDRKLVLAMCGDTISMLTEIPMNHEPAPKMHKTYKDAAVQQEPKSFEPAAKKKTELSSHNASADKEDIFASFYKDPSGGKL